MMLAILLTSFLLPVIQQDDADQIVRLRDGRLLVGAIVEHNLDGLVLTTALDGGRYELSWRDLFPGEADRLRDNFGYRNQTQVPMTTAHRVLLQNGREIIGRLLREDNLNLEIRVRDTTSLVPKSRLAAPPEEVVVEASTILTPEQYYAERVPQIDSTSRFAHFDFAQELEVMFALEEAKAHYLLSDAIAVAEGDEALQKRIEGALAKLENTIANRVEAQKLDMIRQMMHRNRFTVAEGLLAQFDHEHSASPLRGEYLQLADRFQGRRDTAVTRYLERHWFNRVVKVLQRKSLEKSVAMDQLTSWLDTQVPLLVRQQLLTEIVDMDTHLDLGTIDARWLARLETSPSAHTAGFNDGTWILGEEKATAGLKAEEEAKDDGKSAQQREMEDRMKRYLNNIQASRRSAAGANGDVSPEDWWRRASPTSRFQWMLAYYSEFSGDYNVISVKFTYCPTCAGKGYIEVIDLSQSGSRQRKKKCPTCHGIQVRRSVNFK